MYIVFAQSSAQLDSLNRIMLMSHDSGGLLAVCHDPEHNELARQLAGTVEPSAREEIAREIIRTVYETYGILPVATVDPRGRWVRALLNGLPQTTRSWTFGGRVSPAQSDRVSDGPRAGPVRQSRAIRRGGTGPRLSTPAARTNPALGLADCLGGLDAEWCLIHYEYATGVDRR